MSYFARNQRRRATKTENGSANLSSARSPPQRDASPGWQPLPVVSQGFAEGSAPDALLFEEQLLHGLGLHT